MNAFSEYCYINHVLNILGDCELAILIRLRLEEDAVPDVLMRSEKKTISQTEKARSRTVQQVVRGE